MSTLGRGCGGWEEKKKKERRGRRRKKNQTDSVREVGGTLSCTELVERAGRVPPGPREQTRFKLGAETSRMSSGDKLEVTSINVV